MTAERDGAWITFLNENNFVNHLEVVNWSETYLAIFGVLGFDSCEEVAATNFQPANDGTKALFGENQFLDVREVGGVRTEADVIGDVDTIIADADCVGDGRGHSSIFGVGSTGFT